ncbi:MAG: DUF3048 domain-containing protein [Acutalibacteraceae bacterium]
MLKKSILIFLCLAICLLAGCSKKTERLSVDKGDEPSSSEAEQFPVLYKNPLTGISELTADKADDRPIAIMINNISTAQPVQTGLNKADIIFETEVEGGITRLMAVFQDVNKAEKIGTIRSARYPYVDLALGLNAIYLHRGQDEKYCAPHLKDIDDIDISESNYGVRISNGLASEHTLYTYGDKLWNGLVKDGVKTERGSSEAWMSFADEDAPVAFENSAASVSVPFSASYKTVMKYDSATGRYTRYFGNNIRKDYVTGEAVTVKNVFVLLTSIRNYSDGYHRQVALESGDGYYCVNGTYTAIKWSKGAAKNGFKFTKADGTELTVNPGNSWVCIADKGISQPVFE